MNVKTLQANRQTGQFSVQFQRPFYSDETGRDENLTFGDMPFIWSYGNIVNGNPSFHGNYGTFNLNLLLGDNDAN